MNRSRPLASPVPFAAACLALALALAACGRGGEDRVTVFAAVSLRAPLEQVATAFERGHPGSDVSFNFGGSQQLRFQLEQGAAASVFVSADEAQMRLAQDAGVLEGEPQLFARNRLAVALPAGNPAGIQRLEDLARANVDVVWAGPAVPLGAYTREALEAMASAYGADFPQRVQANVVSEEENAEAVVAKVELGEADAAFVYVSDSRRLEQEGASVIDIPDAFQPDIRYLAAALRDAGDPALARAFVDFLRSADAQRALIEAGFVGVR